MGLPDKSGSEVLEWLMRNDPGVCVVIFSGSQNIQEISSALEEGARGYIPKPFVKEAMLNYIKGRHTSI
jgi:DNA-binding NarL/FixJ family response regulator